MEIEWKLFADLREYAGTDRVAVDLDADGGGEATVGDALAALIAAHEALDGRVFDEDGRVRDHVNVLKNGENVETTAEGLDTPVAAGDELALFPPVSGGDGERGVSPAAGAR
jgi:molybdopterin synthase sulfur carrier subunit